MGEPARIDGSCLNIHNDILFKAIEKHDGRVFKIVGDEFQAAFATAPQALQAAIDIQLGLQSAQWNHLGPLKVRMGLHTGEAHLDEIIVAVEDSISTDEPIEVYVDEEDGNHVEVFIG